MGKHTGNSVDDEASFVTLSCLSVAPREADPGLCPPCWPDTQMLLAKLVPEHLTVCVCCSRWSHLLLWLQTVAFVSPGWSIWPATVPRWIGPETTNMLGFHFWVDNPTCINDLNTSYWGQKCFGPMKGSVVHVCFFPLISHGPTSLSVNWREELFSCLVCFTLWCSQTSRHFQEAELNRLTSASYPKRHSPV